MDSPKTCQGGGGGGQAQFLSGYTLPEHLKQSDNSKRRKRYSFIVLFSFVAVNNTLSMWLEMEFKCDFFCLKH